MGFEASNTSATCSGSVSNSRMGSPFYAGVERDNVAIHLQAASETKRQPGHGAINVFVTGVDTLYQELKSKGARTMEEPADRPYGMAISTNGPPLSRAARRKKSCS